MNTKKLFRLNEPNGDFYGICANTSIEEALKFAREKIDPNFSIDNITKFTNEDTNTLIEKATERIKESIGNMFINLSNNTSTIAFIDDFLDYVYNACISAEKDLSKF